MSRHLFIAFGLVCYAISMATILYLIGFSEAVPGIPRSVDFPNAGGDIVISVAIDVLLILLFALQHSAMARPGFKAGWKRIVPAPIERSFYVLLASAALILLFLLWRPIPATVWTVANRPAAIALWVLSGIGWAIVFISTFLISHFELFGLRQVWHNWRGRTAGVPVLRQPFFYRVVRHPLYSGFFLAFWATPHMTAGHLLLAGGLSAFMLIAIRFEERDLVDVFGSDYQSYQQRTAMLVPGLRRRRA